MSSIIIILRVYDAPEWPAIVFDGVEDESSFTLAVAQDGDQKGTATKLKKIP